MSVSEDPAGWNPESDDPIKSLLGVVKPLLEKMVEDSMRAPRETAVWTPPRTEVKACLLRPGDVETTLESMQRFSVDGSAVVGVEILKALKVKHLGPHGVEDRVLLIMRITYRKEGEEKP